MRCGGSEVNISFSICYRCIIGQTYIEQEFFSGLSLSMSHPKRFWPKTALPLLLMLWCTTTLGLKLFWIQAFLIQSLLGTPWLRSATSPTIPSRPSCSPRPLSGKAWKLLWNSKSTLARNILGTKTLAELLSEREAIAGGLKVGLTTLEFRTSSSI